MDQVILAQELEGDWLAGTDSALRLKRILGQVRHDMRQIPVVTGPKCDQSRPGHFLNVLHADATLLIVAWKLEGALESGANKTLMVVGSRVNQMPHHLFPGPTARTNRCAAIGFADLKEPGLRGLHQPRRSDK